MAEQISIQIDDAAKKQIADLKRKWANNNRSAIILRCIERVWQAECNGLSTEGKDHDRQTK